jgi:hypothetical protein
MRDVFARISMIEQMDITNRLAAPILGEVNTRYPHCNLVSEQGSRVSTKAQRQDGVGPFLCAR